MRQVRTDSREKWHAEDAPCWMCGQKIDWDADDGITDGSFEYDHYYPAGTHPEHYDDPANGRPSHRGCNRDRSNGAPRASLGTLFRAWL
jgi:hypothetical protein